MHSNLINCRCVGRRRTAIINHRSFDFSFAPFVLITSLVLHPAENTRWSTTRSLRVFSYSPLDAHVQCSHAGGKNLWVFLYTPHRFWSVTRLHYKHQIVNLWMPHTEWQRLRTQITHNCLLVFAIKPFASRERWAVRKEARKAPRRTRWPPAWIRDLCHIVKLLKACPKRTCIGNTAQWVYK